MAVHPLLGEPWGVITTVVRTHYQLLPVSHTLNLVSGVGLEKTELERLQIVDAIKGYKSKSASYRQ